MTLAAAAKLLGRHVSTLRKYVRQGMPTVSLGGIGRGRATVINLEQAKVWIAERHVPTLRSRDTQDTLQLLATALYDCLKRDDLAACAEISPAQASMVVLKIYARASLNLHQEPLTPDTLPPELKPLHAIVLESMERGTFYQRR